MPQPRESDDNYRERVIAWCEAVPMEANETEGFRQAEVAYICSLAWVPID